MFSNSELNMQNLWAIWLGKEITKIFESWLEKRRKSNCGQSLRTVLGTKWTRILTSHRREVSMVAVWSSKKRVVIGRSCWQLTAQK